MNIQPTYTEQLVQKGQQLLQEGKYKAAGKKFAAALKLDECAPIRNNLALAAFMDARHLQWTTGNYPTANWIKLLMKRRGTKRPAGAWRRKAIFV